MTETKHIISCLAQTPEILSDFLSDIPIQIQCAQRRKNKWTIHEHACHICKAETMILKRLEVFYNNSHPVFKPYFPDLQNSESLPDLILDEQLLHFKQQRNQMIDLLKNFNEDIWNKSATHAEYHTYTAKILVRHTLMHDHFHMYRMEELWLTHENYL